MEITSPTSRLDKVYLDQLSGGSSLQEKPAPSLRDIGSPALAGRAAQKLAHKRAQQNRPHP